MSVRVQFGKYGLVERLASGGMGETWLADLNAIEGVTKLVLIKKMLPDLAESPDRVRAFIDEARVTATLSHGNIAQLFDFGQVDGDYFLALEYVHGQSLERVVARAKKLGHARLPFAISVFIVSELLKALHYAHTRLDANGQPLNLVHRDVSPDNLLVSYEGEVKLIDFGVAKTSDLGRTKTMPGLVKGKYHYHSPEQALGQKLDRRSDVFGAGIVLFELLSGGQMFTGQGHVAMQAVANGDIPQLRARAADVPEALAALAMKAVAPKPDDRFETALQMQEQLSRWLVTSTPEFSPDLLRALMGELFEKELRDEGVRQPRAAGVTERLRALEAAASKSSAPAAASTATGGGSRSVLPLVGIATAVVLAGGLGVWAWSTTRDVPGCERAGDSAMARGDEAAARLALKQCLGARAPSPAETDALAGIDTCANQRTRLREAELGLSLLDADRAERALGFAAASCVVAQRDALVGRVQALRDQQRTTAEQQQVAAEQAARGLTASNEPQTPAQIEATSLIESARKFRSEKEPAKAKDALLRCVKLDPRRADCFVLLGAAYGDLGQGAAGVKAYEKFLELAPDHPEAAKVRLVVKSYYRSIGR